MAKLKTRRLILMSDEFIRHYHKLMIELRNLTEKEYEGKCSGKFAEEIFGGKISYDILLKMHNRSITRISLEYIEVLCSVLRFDKSIFVSEYEKSRCARCKEVKPYNTKIFRVYGTTCRVCERENARLKSENLDDAFILRLLRKETPIVDKNVLQSMIPMKRNLLRLKRAIKREEEK